LLKRGWKMSSNVTSSNVLYDIMSSAVSFRKCTAEKLAFVILNFLDLGLTLLAISIGLSELNPLMRSMLGAPYQIYLVKMGIPLLLAWLLPGKLLIPAIALLAFIVGWDLKELLVYFI
jgi:hypothetical protein